jgi:hypothetical protein
MNEQQFNSLPFEQRALAQKRLIEMGLITGLRTAMRTGTEIAFKQQERAQDEPKAAHDAAN